MHMVGHDYKSIQRDPREMLWNSQPASSNHFASLIQIHLIGDDVTKHASPLGNTDRDEGAMSDGAGDQPAWTTSLLNRIRARHASPLRIIQFTS
jgi:hypothetical protein